MSRLRRFVHSLASGYLLLGANVIYTLVSVPLALYYLSSKEFGLWVVVSQIATNLHLLIGMGMSGSVARILIDHKDDKASSTYGTVIKTGFVAMLIQGILITVAGALITIWLPDIMKVQQEFRRIFQILIFWQCCITGASFLGRIFMFILQAHHRYDVCNYSQIVAFGVNLAVLWLGLHLKFGLYSMLFAGWSATAFANIYWICATWQLKLLPRPGQWGRVNWITFREIFLYATDLFVMTVGQVMISLSQAPLIGRTLGFDAAAVWSIATKTLVLAQQLISRLLDYSAAALGEMMVRGEKERLLRRFRDLLIVTASFGALLCLTVAMANQSFLKIWTHGRISWNFRNDLLMAGFVVITAITRCNVGLVSLTKQIGGMKYIYLIEGVVFVSLGLLLAPRLGLTGIIASGIVSNLFCSGYYGVRRTASYFGLSFRDVIFGWLNYPARLFLAVLAGGMVWWFLFRGLPAPAQFATVSILGLFGIACLWRIGLPSHLQAELALMIGKFWSRLRS